MQNRLLSSLFGILMGLCVPLFLWTLFAEHLTFFIILPIFPLVGAVLGLLLGLFNRIPPLKIWVSLLIFTIFIGASAGYSEIRGILMRTRREHIATLLSMQYPESKIIEKKYSRGNGMEVPPNASIVMKSDSPYEEIVKYYDEQFRENGWQSSHPWKKNNYQVFLHKDQTIAENGTNYILRVDFLGSWMTHFSKI
ncbi:hypothetical protein COU80_06040 [Candidatus Peregrinibacteria bacterium CG10_big_fil_rev_8_21_14_0_10_55_24]|nr:MAG: hypothetical protein COU80_06040 [Candidatus Peregrinibacteria bacterium CG10_big_fil_rev_8_21_14_0_10_55_24]